MTAIASRAAIHAVGLRKSYGAQVVRDGIDVDVPEGTGYALSGPDGAGKTTTVHILSTLIAADGGQVEVAGHDIGREPDAVRAAIGVTGQFSAVDRFLTGEENLLLMADLRHLGARDGRRLAAELLERFDLVRRDAAQARPRDDAGRRPADHLPRRADRRARSPQPAHDVAGHPRSRRPRRHDLPDHPVPRSGGSTRRSDRGPRPRQAGRRGHAVRAQAPGSRRQRSARVRRCERAGAGCEHVPGIVPRRRIARPAGPQRRWHRLPARAARRAGPSVHRRRRAVGSHPGPRRRLPLAHGPHRCPGRSRVMTSRSYVISDTATMLRRNLRHMRRYPSLTLLIAGIPVVFLLLFVYVFGGTLGKGLGGVAVGRDAYLAYVIPGILLMTLAGVAQGTAISVAIDMTEGT